MSAWRQWFVQSCARTWRQVRDGARLAIGIGDYEAYVDHVRTHHPQSTPMDREAYFQNRLAARYGRGRSRCC